MAGLQRLHVHILSQLLAPEGQRIDDLEAL
jgi:hypothetical protein